LASWLVATFITSSTTVPTAALAAAVTATAGGGFGDAMVAQTLAAFNLASALGRPMDAGVAVRAPDTRASAATVVFSYKPPQAILTIGQETEFRPQLVALPMKVLVMTTV